MFTGIQNFRAGRGPTVMPSAPSYNPQAFVQQMPDLGGALNSFNRGMEFGREKKRQAEMDAERKRIQQLKEKEVELQRQRQAEIDRRREEERQLRMQQTKLGIEQLEKQTLLEEQARKQREEANESVLASANNTIGKHYEKIKRSLESTPGVVEIDSEGNITDADIPKTTLEFDDYGLVNIEGADISDRIDITAALTIGNRDGEIQKWELPAFMAARQSLTEHVQNTDRINLEAELEAKAKEQEQEYKRELAKLRNSDDPDTLEMGTISYFNKDGDNVSEEVYTDLWGEAIELANIEFGNKNIKERNLANPDFEERVKRIYNDFYETRVSSQGEGVNEGRSPNPLNSDDTWVNMPTRTMMHNGNIVEVTEFNSEEHAKRAIANGALQVGANFTIKGSDEVFSVRP